MGEFNPYDHYSTTVAKNPLEKNGVALIVNKTVQNAVLGCNLKNDRMILVCFQGKPFNITIIPICALPLMLKKMKLNGSTNIYKTFQN